MAPGHDRDVDHQSNVGLWKSCHVLLLLDVRLLVFFSSAFVLISFPSLKHRFVSVLSFASVPIRSLSQRSTLRSSGLHSLSFSPVPASDGLPIPSLASLLRFTSPSLVTSFTFLDRYNQL